MPYYFHLQGSALPRGLEIMHPKSLSMSLALLSCALAIVIPPLVVSAQIKTPAAKVDTPKAEQQAAASSTGGKDSAVACTTWIDPINPPRAALLCIHGLGLNSDTYRNFATRMCRRGIATYAIDVRGFGAWMKANGKAHLDFEGTLQDVKSTLTRIHKAHPKLPVFLLGESMGGAIALRAASMYPELIQGLISAVPAGDRFDQKNQDLKVAVESLKRPVA